MKKVQSFLNDGETIKALMYNAKEAFPTNAAFKVKVSGEIRTVTFLQMMKDVESLGTELSARGFDGQRMGIIGENSYEWFNCFLTVVCGGNIAVPFDKGLTTEELIQCVNRSDIRALFFDEKHSEMAAEIKEKCSQELALFRITGEGNDLDEMRTAGNIKMTAGDRSYLDRPVNRSDLAVFLFTSGTTSNSKVVMLSHDNISSNITDMLQMKIFYPTDVNMAFLPFHHSFGLVGCLVFLSSGSANVFCDGLKYVAKNLEEYGVTVFVGVPLIVENLYGKIMKQVEKQGMMGKVEKGLKLAAALDKIGIHQRRKIFSAIIEKLGGHLRLIICGAASLSKDVAKGLNNFGISTIQGYGLTETSPVLTAERPWALCAGSVGTPMKSVRIYIDAPDKNGIGEIVAWGPNIMQGYLHQPEETDKVLKDGWFFTGDLGRIDQKGNLWICGRKKNVIVMKNGKNIFPEEIESLIEQLPYVAESMIFTREKHNELVLWCKIVYAPDYLQSEGISEEQLAERVSRDLMEINKTLPVYKYINHFILSDIPMVKTTTQKIKRNLAMKEISDNWEDIKAYNTKDAAKQ